MENEKEPCPYFGYPQEADLYTPDFVADLIALYLRARDWARGGEGNREAMLALVEKVESHGVVKPYEGEL